MSDQPDDTRLSHAITADLIHELRHPLMAIKLGLNIVQSELGAQLAASADWPVVLAQVARLEDLLQTYQHLASPEGIPAGWFELGPMVQEVIDSCQPALKSLGERFVFIAPPAGSRAWGSAMTSRHALRNLLLNALDAIAAKGSAARIEVRVLLAGGRAEVRVSDSGSGISPEVSSRIFESGFTTKPMGKGAGLGLAIARRLMKAAGGEVRLVSEGAASRLTWAAAELCLSFSVPAAPAQASPRNRPRPQAR